MYRTRGPDEEIFAVRYGRLLIHYKVGIITKEICNPLLTCLSNYGDDFFG